MFRLSVIIFYRGVPGFATDCPCRVCCCGLTTCLQCVGPLFGNIVWGDSGTISLISWRTAFLLCSISFVHMFHIYLNASQHGNNCFIIYIIFTFRIVLYFWQNTMKLSFYIIVVMMLSIAVLTVSAWVFVLLNGFQLSEVRANRRKGNNR